jgi:hypothetical protein
VLHARGFRLEAVDLPDGFHQALDEALIVDTVEDLVPDQAVYIVGLAVRDSTRKGFPGLLGFIPRDGAGIPLEVCVEHTEVLRGALEIAYRSGAVFRAKRHDKICRGAHRATVCNKIGKGDNVAPYENAGNIAVQSSAPVRIAVYGSFCADNRGKGCPVGAVVGVRDPGDRHIAMRASKPQEIAKSIAARNVRCEIAPGFLC